MPGEPRGMWTSNRMCQAAIMQRNRDIHLQRLREARPSIDTRDPRRPKAGNGKAQRLEEERNAQIMHENTILLDKLSKILTREKTAQAGGAKLPTVAAPPTAGGGLHDIYRRKVREQIDRENQSLLRRLQYMKPSIDMVHFEQQWRENSAFARSQVIGNPMMEPRAAPRQPSSRPQTVPSGGARSGRGRPSSAARGGIGQTPAHYLQPLYSEREGAAFAPGQQMGYPPADAFPPAGDQAMDQALYAELGASEVDELLHSAQSALVDVNLGGSSLGDGGDGISGDDASGLGSASAAN